ncbi:MAG: hypothetical protein H0T92_02900 [Pyrinomonadaceae bacterium]|jgi:hypothetical protein|nr:hypothetical protein [Pyrinomonadaceae bacterium]
MHSSGASKRLESKEDRARQQEAELKIVEQARAESREEVAALEEMKQHARAAFISGAAATEEDFERYWPDLRNEMFRQRAHHGNGRAARG